MEKKTESVHIDDLAGDSGYRKAMTAARRRLWAAHSQQERTANVPGSKLINILMIKTTNRED
jgi:hypothetical protein